MSILVRVCTDFVVQGLSSKLLHTIFMGVTCISGVTLATVGKIFFGIWGGPETVVTTGFSQNPANPFIST